MKIFLFLAGLSLLLASPLGAEVPRPSPDFEWVDSTGSAKKSKDLRGHPLVLLVAPSPNDRTFRAQVGQLQKIYERFAAEQTLCIAAFSSEPGVIRSNIPFLTVAKGVATAEAYDAVTGFAIAIIGQDGNLDYFSTRVVPAQRIFDIIDNSYAKQMKLRRK